MKERLTLLIKVVLMLGVCTGIITLMYIHEGNANTLNSTIPQTDTVAPPPEFLSKSAEDGLSEALIYYDIKHSDIVYAQAVLETGHFKSQGCLQHNNLFGLYNSKAKRYCRFNHWSESVTAYKEWIQRRYKPPEDYYKFLKRIGYAADPRYISKLKQIVKNQDDKRRYVEGDTLS